VSIFKEPPPLFKHQEDTVEFFLRTPRVLCFSDAGTGKTRSVIESIRAQKHLGKTLILAPKSILEPAWGNDIRKFAPELTYSVARAHNRRQGFDANVDVIITNFDAVQWLFEEVKKKGRKLDMFYMVVMDESTAFKNSSAQRSKKLAAMIDNFSHRIALTGTPAPNTILDIWHQAYLIDGGERLGKSFYKFRGVACEPENPFASFKTWKDKPGIKEAVADLLSPIVIRHKLEDCLDIPENHVVEYTFQLNATARAAYKQMVKESLLDCDLGAITAAQAGVLASKLSQIASGAVYGDENTTILLGEERTELIVQLIEERDQCVVAFLWKHQRNALQAAFEKAGIAYGVIDGEATDKQREAAVADFQAGNLKVILAHPQSAGHGLTLTRGTTTIWASPTYNAEFYAQFNARIYRATQTKRTTTIHIVAEDTIDSDVYKKLLNKHMNMLDLLALTKENYELNRD
jgi:SNF2 family DNA or RNA helicase